jgi:hypothetical protein
MASALYKLPGVSRAERILGALAAHPEGLSAGELADLTEPPGRVGPIRCSGKLAELRRLGWVGMVGTATGRGRYPARAVGIWQLAAVAEEITLLRCAAVEMTPAHAGIVARILLRSRHAPAQVITIIPTA